MKSTSKLNLRSSSLRLESHISDLKSLERLFLFPFFVSRDAQMKTDFSFFFNQWLQVLRSPRAEHSVDSTSVRPFEEKLGRRFMITCRSLKLMLQGCINESETDPVTNVSSEETSNVDHLKSSRPPTHRAQSCLPPDRAVLCLAVSAGRARRQEGVGRFPRGPEPRGSASDAVRLL